MGTDYAAIFSSMPTPYLVLLPDLTIVDANPAYLRMTGRTFEELLGRHVFDAFPAEPGDAQAAVELVNIKESFERARDTGEQDTMPALKYSIPDGAGGFAEHYWSVISIPVLDDTGTCVLLLQRPEDITDYVRERDAGLVDRERSLLRRTEEAESDLFARSQELAAAREAEALASRRLAVLAGVALQVASAETVGELTDIIMNDGLGSIGANGGAVAVLTEGSDTVQLTITESLGVEGGQRVRELPIAGPLPPCVAIAKGVDVVLPDRETSVAFAPEMTAIVENTGCVAWLTIPLQVGARNLGSLTAGWREPQAFAPKTVNVIAAFAAQCAQTLDRLQIREAEQSAHDQVRRLSETLQRSLLTDLPKIPHLEIAARYLPAAEQAQVGGDWYDAFRVADGSTALVIGDVAGHDRNAAAAMAQVRNVLRGVAHTVDGPPGVILAALDRALVDLEVDVLATAIYAKIDDPDPSTPGGSCDPVLHWSNAGHPHPLLITADGTAQLLDRDSDLLLGLDADTPRQAHRCPLPAGSTVLLYTDGLIERRGAALDDGFSWLAATASRVGHLDLEELCDAILEEVRHGLEDDAALLAIRVSEGGPR